MRLGYLRLENLLCLNQRPHAPRARSAMKEVGDTAFNVARFSNLYTARGVEHQTRTI